MLPAIILALRFRRNRGQIAEVVVFAAVGDGFEIFGISTVGDADTGDLALLCHVYRLLFFYNGIIGKLISDDSAALFHKPDDPLCVGSGMRNLIQGLLYKFLPVRVHHSFCIVFATVQRICGLYKLENFVI